MGQIKIIMEEISQWENNYEFGLDHSPAMSTFEKECYISSHETCIEWVEVLNEKS